MHRGEFMYLCPQPKILELKRKTEELKWRMIYDKIWKNYITSSFQEENND